MTCALCRGSGHLFCHHAGRREWWPCPACHAVGARLVGAPAEIRIGAAQGAYLQSEHSGRRT